MLPLFGISEPIYLELDLEDYLQNYQSLFGYIHFTCKLHVQCYSGSHVQRPGHEESKIGVQMTEELVYFP